MSQYRFLQDHYIAVGGGMTIPAGSTQSTADAGGLLPTNWIPSNSVDPIDASAITAFFNAGVQLWLGCRIGVNGFAIAPPAIYWKSVGPGLFQLTGAGASLGARSLANHGAVP
jgi:hypothetical protein